MVFGKMEKKKMKFFQKNNLLIDLIRLKQNLLIFSNGMLIK